MGLPCADMAAVELALERLGCLAEKPITWSSRSTRVADWTG